MFTGLVEEQGSVIGIESLGDSVRLTLRGPVVTSDASHGDSIAVNGCCLTVIDLDGDAFTADVMTMVLGPLKKKSEAQAEVKAEKERVTAEKAAEREAVAEADKAHREAQHKGATPKKPRRRSENLDPDMEA